MTKYFSLINKCIIYLFLITSTTAISQIGVNSFYPQKNDITVALSYTNKNSDTFYTGPKTIIDNPDSFGEISSSIYSLYARYGINDFYSLVATLPYITTENENGVPDPVKGVSKVEGLQDFSLFFKAKIHEIENRNHSKFTIGAAAGAAIPLGYDEQGILSLGQGATTYTVLGLFQYVLSSNLFSEFAGGYALKQNPDFNVADALLYKLKLGYYNDFFYFDIGYTLQNSTSGFDIGSEEFIEAGSSFALAETKVNCENLELNLYIPLLERKLGISAGFSEIVGGRNKANNTSFSLGLVYNWSEAKNNYINYVVPATQ